MNQIKREHFFNISVEKVRGCSEMSISMMPKMTTSKTTFYDKKKLSSSKFHHFRAFIIPRANKIFRYTVLLMNMSI